MFPNWIKSDTWSFALHLGHWRFMLLSSKALVKLLLERVGSTQSSWFTFPRSWCPSQLTYEDPKWGCTCAVPSFILMLVFIMQRIPPWGVMNLSMAFPDFKLLWLLGHLGQKDQIFIALWLQLLLSYAYDKDYWETMYSSLTSTQQAVAILCKF